MLQSLRIGDGVEQGSRLRSTANQTGAQAGKGASTSSTSGAKEAAAAGGGAPLKGTRTFRMAVPVEQRRLQHWRILRKHLPFLQADDRCSTAFVILREYNIQAEAAPQSVASNLSSLSGLKRGNRTPFSALPLSCLVCSPLALGPAEKGSP